MMLTLIRDDTLVLRLTRKTANCKTMIETRSRKHDTKKERNE